MCAQDGPSLWCAFRHLDGQCAPRIIVSVISGLMLSAGACAGAWTYARQVSRRGFVRYDDIGLAFMIAAALWLAALLWIWSGVARRAWRGPGHGRIKLPQLRLLLQTLAVCVMTGAIAGATATFVRPNGKVIMSAVLLFGGAIAVTIWSPVLLRMQGGRPVMTPDDHVDIRCPRCGYSLIGLRDLRCPECGARFTIDELIRAQHYDMTPAHPP